VDTREVVRVPRRLIVVERITLGLRERGIDLPTSRPHDNDWSWRLPEDADHSACELRERLRAATSRAVASSSRFARTRWRNGAAALQSGVAACPASKICAGIRLFGYQLQVTPLVSPIKSRLPHRSCKPSR